MAAVARRQFLGLDIGTSSVKACVVDERGRTIARASEPLRLRAPHPGWAEQDPADWWKATRRVLGRVTAGRRATIQTVGLSGQMHTSVFLDGSGKVIRPALLWCDSRTTEQCREIAARVSPAHGTEQFAFKQRRRDRSAIHRLKRPSRP